MTGDHKITFGTLSPDGGLSSVRLIKQSDIAACPHFIFVPSHYRDDGSCRCNDADAVEMKDWGYEWRDGKWIAPDDGGEL